MGASDVTGPGGVPPVQGSKYSADRNYYRCYPGGRLLRVITRTVRVRKRRRDGRVLPKARPNGVSPPSGHSSHLTTCRDPVIISHTIPTLQCRKKCWRVLTTRVQENKVDQ